MKTNIFKSLLMVAVILGTTSCNDMLNLNPQDQLSDGNMWVKATDYQQFANNFYGWTRDFSSTLNGWHSDKSSDLITYETYNDVSHGSNTVPTSDGDYTGCYSDIRRTNMLLQHAESYGNQTEIAQYMGEAYFFRAYCYFELLQKYGDVIVTTNVLDIDSPEMQQARNSRQDVINRIVEDLQMAIEKLPKFSEIGAEGYARISKEGAAAFLSRVALYEGTWQENRDNYEEAHKLLDIAANAAKQVIDSKQFSLFGTSGKSVALGDSAYKYMFILEDTKSNPAGVVKADNKEYIFARCHDESLKSIGINITKGCLANTLWVTQKLAGAYLCQDGLPKEKSSVFQGYAQKASEFQNRDNRMRYTLLAPGTRYFSNAVGKSRTAWDASDYADPKQSNLFSGSAVYANQKFATERFVEDKKESYDYPIIRYAEVLLNYAEAVFERDGSISDADLDISLNLVRNRANPTMPKLSNALVSSNGLSMREEIRRERTVELYLEGFRLDDLKRWKTAEVEMPQDMLGVKVTGTAYEADNFKYPLSDDGFVILESSRRWAQKNYLFPLPTDQLELNKQLKQNPSWK